MNKRLAVGAALFGWACCLSTDCLAQPVPPPNPGVDAIVDDALKSARQPPLATMPGPGGAVAASEMETIRRAIRPCWNLPAGLSNRDAPSVRIIVQLGRDGVPVKMEIPDAARYSSEKAYRLVADSAQQAIMNPRCQPWPLPPGKYNQWRTTTFYFHPLAGTP